MGKRLLAAQSFDIDEGTDVLPAGTELTAHVAAWLTVADGRIRDHETFDCYDPMN